MQRSPAPPQPQMPSRSVGSSGTEQAGSLDLTQYLSGQAQQDSPFLAGYSRPQVTHQLGQKCWRPEMLCLAFPAAAAALNVLMKQGIGQ